MPAEVDRRVPRLTIGDRRRYLQTRIIAVEGERDRVEHRWEQLKQNLHRVRRNSNWSAPEVVTLMEEINPVYRRWGELNQELRTLKQEKSELEIEDAH